MLDKSKLELLFKLKDEELIKEINSEDLDNLPPELAMKWCKAAIKISNKYNAKLGKENRQKEIKRLQEQLSEEATLK